MPRTKETIFVDDLTTSFFLKAIIETSSSKISAKLNEILTSFDVHSTHSSSLRSEKYFSPASGSSLQKIELLYQLYRSQTFLLNLYPLII